MINHLVLAVIVVGLVAFWVEMREWRRESAWMDVDDEIDEGDLK